MNLQKSNYIRILWHSAVWLGIIVLINSELMGIQWGPFSRGNHSLFWALLYGMTINATLFYTNAYWQIPQQLQKKKYIFFISWTIFLLVSFTILEIVIDTIFYPLHHHT